MHGFLRTNFIVSAGHQVQYIIEYFITGTVMQRYVPLLQQ